jgi:hypothetical protein
MALRVGDVETRLGFHVDDSGADRYERRTKQLRTEAKRDIKTDAKVDVDGRGFSEYERRARQVHRHNDDMVRGSARVRTGMSSLFVGGGLFAVGATAAYGLARGLGFVVDQFGESDRVAKQSNTVLRSTHEVANVTTKEVISLADALSKKSGIDDENVQSGENLLLTFTKIRNEAGRGNDIFDQATKAALDLSVAWGTDMHSASITVGKALNDPIKGVVALSRVGVQFTQSQKDTIKSLEESGHHLKAQKIILRELRTEVGGSAKAYGNTLPGAMGKLRTMIGNVAEWLGGKLAPAFNKAIDWGKGFVRQLRDGTGAGGKIRDVIRSVSGTIGDFIEQIRSGTGAGGALRRIFEALATSVGRVATAVFPVIRGLVQVVGKVAQFGIKLAGTRVGIAALHAVLGALVGRLAGLGVAWAVSKVVGFASAVRGARAAVAALSIAVRANPIGVLATVLGAVVGALIGFGSQEKRAKVSTQDLNDALREQRDALRAVRDLDIDAKEAKTRYRAATLNVRAAEIRLADMRKHGRKGTLEYKQAEVDLQDARNEQRRSQRDLTDQEQHGKDVRAEATKTTRDAIKTARDRVATVKDEIAHLKLQSSGIFKSKEQTDDMRKKQKDLADATRTLNGLLQTQGDIKPPNLAPAMDALNRSTQDSVDFVADLVRTMDRLHSKNVYVNTYATKIISTERRARGGKVDEPGVVVMHGEEAPRYPEYWISTNPRDRDRMVPLLAEAARSIGAQLVGFARGGSSADVRAARRKGIDFPAVGDLAKGQPQIADSDVSNAQRRFDRMQRGYSRMQRIHDLTTEEFLRDDPKTGNQVIDHAAISRRVGELNEEIAFIDKRLIGKKHGKIRPNSRGGFSMQAPVPERGSAQEVIGMIDGFDAGIARILNRVRKFEARAHRLGYKQRAEAYHSKALELSEWRDQIDEQREDTWDQIKDLQVDIQYLQRERADALGTKPPPAAGGGGGGGTTTDPAAVAAAVAAEMGAFQTARSDLFSSFGGNFLIPGSTPSPTQQAAGARALGAVPTAEGYTAAGRGDVTVNIENNYGAGPGDPHGWSRDQRFQVESAFGS